MHCSRDSMYCFPCSRRKCLAMFLFNVCHKLRRSVLIKIKYGAKFLLTVFEESDNQVIRFFILDAFKRIARNKRFNFFLASNHCCARKAKLFQQRSFNLLLKRSGIFWKGVKNNVAAGDYGTNVRKTKTLKYLTQFFAFHIWIGGHDAAQESNVSHTMVNLLSSYEFNHPLNAILISK